MNYEQQSDRIDILSKPIPEIPPIAGWKEVPLEPSAEPLEALGVFSANNIYSSSIYADEYSDSPYYGEDTLDSSLITMFVRASVADRLSHAEQLLPKGYHLVVYDAYRPLGVQQALYDQYYNKLQEIHPEWSQENLSAETQKYVSIPSSDPNKPSPHNTGGAVDVAIYRLPEDIETELEQIDDRLDDLHSQMDKPYQDYTAEEEAKIPFLGEYYALTMQKIGLIKSHAQLLNFGTDFDNGTETSGLRYYEELGLTQQLSPEEEEAARNRRMLYWIMIEMGMQPYADEWWHYNAPESQMGAKIAGLANASFGPAVFTDDLKRFEEMRKLHHEGAEVIAGKLREGVSLIFPFNPIANLLRGMTERALVDKSMVDPHNTALPSASKISPDDKAA